MSYQCDRQVLAYAKGTQELRKSRNRKRTATGELVWTEEADVMFVLALIAWADKSMRPPGARRSFFLEHFLMNNRVVKSRKQIASRLQVLKGEWNGTIYERLLDQTGDHTFRRCSLSPVRDDLEPFSTTNSSGTYSPQSLPLNTSTSSLGFDCQCLSKSEPALSPQYTPNAGFPWHQPEATSSFPNSTTTLDLSYVDSEVMPRLPLRLPCTESELRLHLAHDGSESGLNFRPQFTENENELKPILTQDGCAINIPTSLLSTASPAFNREDEMFYHTPIGQSTAYSINETHFPLFTLTETTQFPNAGTALSPAVSHSRGDSQGAFSCGSGSDVLSIQAGQYVQSAYPSSY